MLGITLLLLYQILGEAIQYSLLPWVPGPLLGMLLLFLSLLAMPSLYRAILPTSKKLMKHLMLIYIVYGTGLMNDGALIQAHFVGLAAIVLCGAAVTLLFSALIGRRIEHGH